MGGARVRETPGALDLMAVRGSLGETGLFYFKGDTNS